MQRGKEGEGDEEPTEGESENRLYLVDKADDGSAGLHVLRHREAHTLQHLIPITETTSETHVQEQEGEKGQQKTRSSRSPYGPPNASNFTKTNGKININKYF